MPEINTKSLSTNQNLSKFEITENFTCIRFLDQNKERQSSINMELSKIDSILINIQ